MRVIKSYLRFSKEPVAIAFSRYEETKGWAIIALDPETHERIATLTTCMPEQKLAFDEVVIKDYSENEGALRTLLEGKIVVQTGRTCRSGFVEMKIVRIVRKCETCAHFREWGVASNEPRPTWGKDGVCAIKKPRAADGGAHALCVMKGDDCNKFLPLGMT